MNQLMMNFRGSDICHQNLDIKKNNDKEEREQKKQLL